MQQPTEKPLKRHVSIFVLAVNSGITCSYSSRLFLCAHHDDKKIDKILHQKDKKKNVQICRGKDSGITWSGPFDTGRMVLALIWTLGQLGRGAEDKIHK